MSTKFRMYLRADKWVVDVALPQVAVWECCMDIASRCLVEVLINTDVTEPLLQEDFTNVDGHCLNDPLASTPTEFPDARGGCTPHCRPQRVIDNVGCTNVVGRSVISGVQLGDTSARVAVPLLNARFFVAGCAGRENFRRCVGAGRRWW